MQRTTDHHKNAPKTSRGTRFLLKHNLLVDAGQLVKNLQDNSKLSIHLTDMHGHLVKYEYSKSAGFDFSDPNSIRDANLWRTQILRRTLSLFTDSRNDWKPAEILAIKAHPSYQADYMGQRGLKQLAIQLSKSTETIRHKAAQLKREDKQDPRVMAALIRIDRERAGLAGSELGAGQNIDYATDDDDEETGNGDSTSWGHRSTLPRSLGAASSVFHSRTHSGGSEINDTAVHQQYPEISRMAKRQKFHARDPTLQLPRDRFVDDMGDYLKDTSSTHRHSMGLLSQAGNSVDLAAEHSYAVDGRNISDRDLVSRRHDKESNTCPNNISSEPTEPLYEYPSPTSGGHLSGRHFDYSGPYPDDLRVAARALGFLGRSSWHQR